MIDLKGVTQELHNKIEQCNYPQKAFDMSITKDEYICYLEIFFDFHHQLETQLSKYKDEFLKYGIEVEKYFRFDLLQKDLQNLHCNKSMDSINHDFTLDCFPKAFGYLYVLTGSAMGGILLAKKVEQNKNLQNLGSINNYFLGFTDQTMQMWKKLMEALKNYTMQSKQNSEDVANGAKECFEVLIKLLDK